MNRIGYHPLILMASTLFAWALPVSAEINGSVALTSNYVSRGISYSNNDPAIQGGLDYSHTTGLYVGTWGSSFNFGTNSHTELDVYAGLRGSLKDALGWDLGIAYYNYPGAAKINYGEIYGGLSYKVFSSKLWASNDYSGTGGNETYLEGRLDFELPMDLGLAMHAGYTNFDTQVGLRDYMDYKISISRKMVGLCFDLSYTDTNENQFGDLEDQNIALTVSKTF